MNYLKTFTATVSLGVGIIGVQLVSFLVAYKINSDILANILAVILGILIILLAINLLISKGRLVERLIVGGVLVVYVSFLLWVWLDFLRNVD